MTHAFRCPKTQLVDFCGEDGAVCPYCGGRHKVYQVGPPPKAPGHGLAKAPFPRHWSYIHGQKLNTWSEYHRANREAGLIDVGRKPESPEPPSKANIPERYRGRYAD